MGSCCIIPVKYKVTRRDSVLLYQAAGGLTGSFSSPDIFALTLGFSAASNNFNQGFCGLYKTFVATYFQNRNKHNCLSRSLC